MEVVLKSLRKDRKLTQKQLGKVVGVTDVTIGYWEKDQNIPGGVSLTKLARYFGVSETFSSPVKRNSPM
ncbi:helix-turn-helix domain-containing protein [Klebsiella pneumoniae]|uniref:helix-turn-helix domain-containing protein n=1 Tax=Klebsiella pneumoniae TaxID=573 RepID=UPI000F828519